MRNTVWVCVLAVLACFAAMAATTAQAGAAGSGKPRLQARILDASQDAIASDGVQVKVTVRRGDRSGGKVKARTVNLRVGDIAPDDEHSSPTADPVPVRISRPGKQTVTVTPSAAAAARLAKCGPRTITARVKGQSDSADLVRTGACAAQPVDLSRANDCDFIGQQSGSLCLLPFPDDYYTKADANSATGRLVDLHTPAMPDNKAGKRVAAGPYALNDGFSPGETILVRVPGLDNPTALANTDAAPIDHIGQYAKPDAPIVVIDEQTGERVPIWAEIDSTAGSAADTLLEVHPAVDYAAGHTYIVAMRRLQDAAGNTIQAPAGFRYYRDMLPSDQAAINDRRDHFESLFSTLASAGVKRSNLYLAWDFTVATDENIAGRALHMRNDAFASLGDTTMADGIAQGDAPDFTVTSTDENPADPQIARRVFGTFEVPCYLAPDCGPGGTFDLDTNGMPQRHGTWTANFQCIIPERAVGAPGPEEVRPAIYGHGLFGGAGEVYGSSTNRDLAEQYGFIMCATDEIGMSGGDVTNTVANILSDMSNFPMMADRLQQGLLDELFLSRLMISPSGFAGAKEFRQDGTLNTPSVIDASQNYYVGASQGGIMGGALTALAPDFTRSVLNVPAMNYSVLLPRSVDYDEFAVFINAQYAPMERPLLLDLVQMLWDRGEPNGYAHRMTTNPLPDTPAHTVLMNIAFGDHQVTNIQADVEARTIGAETRQPVLYPGRWPGVAIMWNVPRIASFPYDGSAAIYGDIGPVRDDPNNPGHSIGVPPPPLTNTPNRDGEDPHGAPRGAPQAVHLMSDFLKPDGQVTNVCGLTACFAGGFTGP